MVTLELEGESEIEALHLGALSQWNELLRELLKGMYHGLNGGLSSAEATVHLALDDGDMTPRAASDVREALAMVERLIDALEPLTARGGPPAPEPLALDQIVISLRPTLDLQLESLGTEFVADASTLPPVRAPWGEVRDALLLLLSRSARAARAAGVRRVDLRGEVDGADLRLRAGYTGAGGEVRPTGWLRAPLA